MVDKFTELILEARHACVPLTRPFRFSLPLTPEIKSTIAYKNSLRRIVQNSRNEQDRIAFEDCNRLVRNLCQELSHKSFDNKLRSLKPGHKSFWNFTKIIKNKCRNVPALKVEGRFLLTETEKADEIAKQFSRSHLNTMPSSAESVVNRSCTILNGDSDFNLDPNILTSPRQITKIIKTLKSGKAPGFDGVPNILLKNLSRKATVFLTYIFNSCFKLSYFPKSWKHASVVPILKPGKDPSNPASYRPISLLSSISKIFEKLILKRLNLFIFSRNNHIIPNHQCGFRQGHSTSHQLTRLVKHVKKKRSQRIPLSTGLLLLDVEKAFDSVWHEALLHKILMKGCDIFLARLIFSFLKNRTFQVVIGREKSSYQNIPFGVPQGAILSPTLYNIFTSDIPTSALSSIATFADDASSTSRVGMRATSRSPRWSFKFL